MPALPKIGGVFRDQIGPVFLTAGVVFLVIAVVRWTGMLQSLELQAYDVLLRARALAPPAERRITIISAGEEEVDPGVAWPSESRNE